ncbi:MAG TPA: HYR domain-containing protein [Verrucomicrobiae bacterium]|nr:HYR domain-containing protein [Verrucomicrobiae bacterium]
MKTPGQPGCRLWLQIALLTLACLVAGQSNARAATILTVTSTADSGAGSLRQTIIDANVSSPPVTINFAIPPFDGTVKTIGLVSGNLDVISNTVAINGFSESGSSPTPTNNPVLLIALDGATLASTGLVFSAGGSAQGLIVQNLTTAGISVAGGVTISQNLITNTPVGFVVNGGTNSFANNFLVNNGTAILVLGSNNTFSANVISNNSADAVSVVGANNSFLGNLVSSNAANGIAISGNNNSFSSNNAISANGVNGVSISGGSNSVVSSSISSNNQDGVLALGTGGNVLSNDTVSLNGAVGVFLAEGADTVVGSTIVSNSGDGVLVSSSANTVGGSFSGAGNVISANASNGIDIAGAVITNSPTPPPTVNVVQGNFIGTDRTGTNNLGNVLSGILIDGTFTQTLDNVVGGTSPGQGNVIAFNGSNGVTVVSNALSNAIFGNSVFTNAALGIELVNGANNAQIFPTLTAALCSNAGVLVDGSITTPAPSNTVHLEFFSDLACDPSGFGQGQTFLGFTDVVSDTNGLATFAAAFTNFDLVGQFVTATASDSSSNTSEFSQCALVTDTIPPTIVDCPSPITSSTGSNDCQAVVPDFTANTFATDNCSPSEDLVITQSPTNGTIVTVGTNTVLITVADLDGNSTVCTSSFIVVDSTPPVITCQSDITNSLDVGQTSAIVTFPTPTATDNCSTSVTVTCTPPSGSIFQLGTTPVTCIAVDSAGNSASCRFNVVLIGPAQVVVDIAPGYCPNILNTKDGGVLQVAIVGSPSLNVSNIIQASVTLNGVLANTNPVPQIEDVAAPFVYTQGCPKKKRDGVPDLLFEFDVNTLVSSLGTVKNGEVKVLTVEGVQNILGTLYLTNNVITNSTTNTVVVTNFNAVVGTSTFQGQDKIKISTKKSPLPKGLKNPF